ncbi:serine/threonine protein kinase [Streptomyces longisporoflavus]|uniref:protein kinase domain-containing protein n=1 Tax=Streptomyces longisporoflavus TaxID=28044 RepID=UPI00167E79F8|nr:serine/threonine-protein kinase [Streptomyces longisporoflavus]GGV57513.1 serine/threonine protein kinase [Streptomyces longisporoflavus]
MSDAEKTGQSRQDKSERLLSGRYRLGEVLGRGGMGTVWRAKDETLGRTVAVKELRFPSSIDDDEKRRLITRTLREAKAIARIRNTSAVTVYDVVDEDDRPWIVMELVEGKSLAEAIREDGLLTPRRAAEVGLAVLDVLRSAHREGILHRDVKPSNVLIAEDGRVVLTDFGIAQVEGDPSITSTGMLVGAPSYISPERARGHKPGPAADLWSLGGLLYAAVEGVPPYDKGSAIATLTAVMTEDVEQPVNAGPLEKVIYGLLAKDPEQRLDDAGARALLLDVIHAPEAKEEPEPVDATKVVPLPPVPPSLVKRFGKGKGGAGRAAGAGTAGGGAAGAAGAAAASSGASSGSGSGSAGSAETVGSSRTSADSGGRKGEEAAERLKGALRSVRKAAAAATTRGAGAGAAGSGADAASGGGGGAGNGSGSGAASGAVAGKPVRSAGAAGAASGAAGAAAAPSASSTPSSRSSRSSLSSSPTASSASSGPSARSGPAVPPKASLTDVVPRRTLVIFSVALVIAVLGTVLAFAFSGGDENDGQDSKNGSDKAASSGATAGGGEKDKEKEKGAGQDDAGEKGKGEADTDAGSGTTPGADEGKDPSESGDDKGDDPGKEPGDGAESTYKHSQGFSVGLPKGWKYQTTAAAGARFTGPNGQKLLIGWTSTPKSDPVGDWKNQESYMVRSQYKRIRIEKVDYRNYNTADWEFTYVDGGTKYRSIDRGFVVNGNLGYGMMYTAKDAKWDSDERKDAWQTFTKTFKPKK